MWAINRDTSATDYVSYMSKFIKCLCQKKTEKVLLLIDLCRCNEEDQLTMELVDLAHLLPSQNLQVVVAFTSATGKFVDNKYVFKYP